SLTFVQHLLWLGGAGRCYAARMAEVPKWSDKLARIVRDRHGTAIITRSDAKRFVLTLPPFRQQRATWQRAAQLPLRGASADEVTEQLERALLVDGDLALDKEPHTR